MDHLLVAVFTLLLFVTLSSTDQVILEKKPASGGTCIWDRSRIQTAAGGPVGWTKLTYYSTCDISLDSFPQPNNWLRSDPIEVHSGVKTVLVTIEDKTNNCSSYSDKGGKYRKNYFHLYEHQSWQPTSPDPLANNATYHKIAKTAAPALGIKVIQTFRVDVKRKYIVLAFNDRGSCSVLFSVTVCYYVCPRLTHISNLVLLPQTVAPANNSKPVEVNCVTAAFHKQGTLSLDCQSDGVWNISSLNGSCICPEGMENAGGKCEECPEGRNNDDSGLNCIEIPSAPQNVNVIFVNQSTLEIQWQPPVETGVQTYVFYEVECRRPCEGEDKSKCVDKACGSDVIFKPRKDGLNITHVIVGNLTSFVNYTITVYSRNRVSDLSKRIHRIPANFAAITIRTNGSLPGKPEVTVGQPEETVVVSWTLKEKNGAIKE